MINIRREYEINTGYSIDYELQGVGNLKYVQWLEKELAASHDSGQCVVSNNASTVPTLSRLSGMPSDEGGEFWRDEYGIIRPFVK